MWKREYFRSVYAKQSHAKNTSDFQSKDDPNETSELTLKKTQIAFHLLWSGFVIAIFSLLIEKLCHKRNLDKEI